MSRRDPRHDLVSFALPAIQAALFLAMIDRQYADAADTARRIDRALDDGAPSYLFDDAERDPPIVRVLGSLGRHWRDLLRDL